MSKKATTTDARIGQNIKTARIAQGLSQGDFAQRLGVTFQQVQKYEKGLNRISASRLIEVANILGQPYGYFIGAEANSGSVPGIDVALAVKIARLPPDRKQLVRGLVHVVAKSAL